MKRSRLFMMGVAGIVLALAFAVIYESSSRGVVNQEVLKPVVSKPTSQPTVVIQDNRCASSSPGSKDYTVSICFASPGSHMTLTGDVPISVTVSTSTTAPHLSQIIFYLNGKYLLTDYQNHTFTLPTTKWADGIYLLSAQAFLRDGFQTDKITEQVTFKNGITSSPTNNQDFQPTSGNPPANGTPFVVVAGGDGASGETNATKVTGLLSKLNPNLFLYLGDVYEQGSLAEFYNWYGTSGSYFSRFRSITDPTVGNHEYLVDSQASGYFNYWDNIPNYYSFNAGGWHFISLNSNLNKLSKDSQTAQYQWLQQDLAAHTQTCTIVYYHHPLYNIGPEGSTTALAPIWSLLAQYGVSIVLNGHDHDYQRWVPLDGNGQPNANGITEFVVGTAGHGLQTFVKSDNRVAYANDTNPTAFGLLKLTLNPGGASYQFINTEGDALDSGVVPCAHAGPDTQPPVPPSNLSVSDSQATRVDLHWGASSDNVGVAGYTIYRDGKRIASLPQADESYVDTTAMPNTTYSYSVDAFDVAGNHSTPTASVSVTTPSMPSSLTIPVEMDTYVNASNPDTNYGSANALRLDASPNIHAYLRFSVQGLAGTSITRAQLQVYANTNSNTGISVYAVSDNQSGELDITQRNAPPLGTLLASSGAFKSKSWVTLDVTSFVKGEGTYTFGITTSSLSAVSLAARESGDHAAQLILDLRP